MLKYIKLFEDFDDEEYSLNIPELSLDGIFYHGTVLRNGEFIDNLSLSYGDYEAVWFTEDENIAEEFSDNNYTSGYNEIKIIFKVKINCDRIADIDLDLFEELKEYYGIFDLRESIPILNNLGYNGWKTIGSIVSEIYDDIAIFNTTCFEIISAKMYINEKWTDYLPLNIAEETYFNWYKNI